jgi:hypothetical protein
VAGRSGIDSGELEGIVGAGSPKGVGGKGPVWQEETFTVELRSQETLDSKCEFVRQNPVRSQVVKTPEDYAWLWLSARM